MSQTKKIPTIELLFASARSKGLQPEWLADSRLFCVSTPTGERYISESMSTQNSHTDANLARNKHHTRLVLDRFNLPNIPYARPKTRDDAVQFLREHGTIIVKPLAGLGAKNITIVKQVSQLDDVDFKKMIFEKYILGEEMRYLVLNDQVIAVHQSDYGVSVAEDRPLKRISISQDDWDKNLVTLSLQVAKIMRLNFATVDFLIDGDGRAYILEVNTAPGLKWFTRSDLSIQSSRSALTIDISSITSVSRLLRSLSFSYLAYLTEPGVIPMPKPKNECMVWP